MEFGDNDTETIFRTGKSRKFGNIARPALRKLRMMEAATSLQDLRTPPGNPHRGLPLMTPRTALHPGEILRLEFMEPLGLSQAQLAKELGVSPSSISRLVNEQADLTAQMALKLETRFGSSAEFWMNLQKSYELDAARQAAVA